MYGDWFFIGILFVFIFYVFLYAPSERKYDKKLLDWRKRNIERAEKRKAEKKNKKRMKRIRKRFW